MTGTTGPDAFAEQFNEPEVNCFHRSIANGCDLLAPGTGLALLYLLSLARALGDPIGAQRQAGLDRAFEAIGSLGLRFHLRRFHGADEMIEALPDSLRTGSVLVFPSGSVGLNFLLRQEVEFAHYPLAVRIAEDGKGFVLRESMTSMKEKTGGVIETVLAPEAAERAIRGFPDTLGAAIDSWGMWWSLQIELRPEGDDAGGLEEALTVVTRHALDSLDDAECKAGMGFDAAQISQFEEIFRSAGNVTDAMCRAYLKDANFAAVHLRAAAIAAGLLSPDIASEAERDTMLP